MSKLPYLPLYTNDWLASAKVATMTPAEEGAYIRLLCLAWNDDNCSLPADDATLATMSRLNENWAVSAQKIRQCFEEHDGRLYNEKLLKCWQDAHIRHEKKSKGGVKGMLSRWGNRVITKLKDSNNDLNKMPITSSVSVISTSTPTPIDTSLKPTVSAPSDAGASAPERQKVPKIGFDGNGWLGVRVEDREAWSKAYPACDIDRQLAAASEWVKANPKKAKKNWRRFLVNWLSRHQEKGGDIKSNQPTRDLAAERASAEIKRQEDLFQEVLAKKKEASQ